MAYGLETIDANGTKVVRVTDRLTRFVQANTLVFPASSGGGAGYQYQDISVAGMVDDGTWVAWVDNLYFTARVYSGFVRVDTEGVWFYSPVTVYLTVLRV